MPNSLYSELKSFWENVILKDNSNPNNIVEHLAKVIMLKFAENNRIYFSIFNFIDFKKEFSTPNTWEVFGIPDEDHKVQGTELLFSFFDKEHAEGVVDCHKYLKIFLEDIKNEKDMLNFSFLYCGLKYQHSQKGAIRLLWKSTVIETNKIIQPVRSLSTFQDTTNLLKSDFYWFRGVFTSSQRTYYITYRSDTNETSKNDILSTREKEILRHLVGGKETEEIANTLFISKTTVNNHRQNMLNKLGVKDTTALIQLAKLTKLI